VCESDRKSERLRMYAYVRERERGWVSMDDRVTMRV
jgi:hypothetical protein